MASSSAQRKRVKTIGQKNMRRPSELDGWISDDEVPSKFPDCWKMRTVFVISWILLPRGVNHAQATTKDLLLLKALKENIQVDWPAAISDNMLKVTRLESAKLSYCVFISKILVHFGVNCVDESSVCYSRTSLVNKVALHMMDLQHTSEGWQFKSEVAEDEDDVEQPSILYRARSEFERKIMREIKAPKVMCQATRDDVLEIKEHLKLNSLDEDDNEDESGEEGTTPDESTRMNVEESEEEDIAEESNNNMLLKTYLKKNKMKV
ncbi:hypothetical protein LR48_Vigan748s000200 [Vigna angularis]|uniref:Uncharacterized protein n=1 Tax=Phaseolus angularis TaxID=3914 RepID=A0A0L9TH13_PHAAN|nr:hypothetical protein LR48_Vigan748s000200 [Vigna angularis]